MNPLIETLNAGGDQALHFAWAMLWQSSLLIGLLFLLEWVLRRKVRAAVRYALWLTVVAKLLLPPSLALPTGVGWWLRPAAGTPKPRTVSVVVSYDPDPEHSLPVANATVLRPPLRTSLSAAAAGSVGSCFVSLGLLVWMLVRWRAIEREAQQAGAAPVWLEALLEETRRAAGLRRRFRVKLLDKPMSPAVCGLLRPAILLPRLLSEQLEPAQLRAVLLHELVHLRRADVWVNCAQALVQVVYWWHPLLWLANGRIRRLREEAVDDAVMQALRDEAETYAPTLLEVAKLALRRPLASLGLVGILESHSSLRERIQRLLDFRPPRKAGLTLGSALWIAAFGALALPMGEGPAKPNEALLSAPSESKPWPDSRFSGYKALGLNTTSNAITPNTYTHTNLFYSNARRQAIIGKLDRIRLQSVAFNDLPFGEVVRWLTEEARKSDPQGLNFFIINSSDTTHGTAASTVAEPADIRTIPIKIAPPQRNVRLADVLDAVIKAADRRIKYAIEDHGVVFSARMVNEPLPLYVRTFKVDPNTFLAGLHARAGLAGTRDLDLPAIHKAAQDCFRSAGVELAPPKSIFFNKSEGSLMVRATLQDLDVIEKAVQVLNIAPPQINIKTKFIELPAASLADFWRNVGAADPAKSGGTNWTTVLTPAQARAALKTVKSIPKADLLTEASVTTLDGRQAQIQCVELRTIVMGINPRALTPPGVNPSSVSTNANDTNALYVAQTLPFGPTLDVVPHAASDGRSVQMTLIPSLTEFLGYDPPTNPVPVYVRGKQEKVTQPLPRFRVRQITNSADVLDGHTLVIGGGIAESVSKTKNKVPVLGDVPLLGGLFRRESSSTEKKQLLVFVTPTFIDPAGNRIHREDEPAPAGPK
jgi:beta-lactamase regulating signal transducer with metallopeptidase domain